VSNEEQIKEILSKYKTIAVVGISNTPGKPSHRVAAYLKQHGYNIIPINPTIEEALCIKSHKSLLDIPPETAKTIEVVDIFRKSEDVPSIVEQAIELKRRYGKLLVIWMQLDIRNEQAAEAAKKAGLIVVMDRCLMNEHLHLFSH
jgi:uncharacterized protein